MPIGNQICYGFQEKLLYSINNSMEKFGISNFMHSHTKYSYPKIYSVCST